MKLFKFRASSLLFYLTLVFVIAVVLLLILGTENSIRDWLRDYEYSQPKYKVDEIFNEYFAEPDAAYLISLTEQPEYNAPDTPDDAIAAFAKKIDGREITYSYVAGSDRKIINVKADGVKFARFAIKLSDTTSTYGFDLYELDSIYLFYDKPEKYANIKIPFNCTVNVNGVKLDEGYLTEDNIVEDTRADVPDGAYLFSYKRYSVKKLYAEPTLTAYDNNGNEVALSYDEENDEYYYRLSYSDALKEQYDDYIIKAAYAYAAYMQNDGRFADVRDYFDSSSVLYTHIKENPGSFVWEHDGYHFANTITGEYYDYGEVISCRITFDHALEKDNREDYIDKIDLTLYLHEVDGVMKIFYMTSN